MTGNLTLSPAAGNDAVVVLNKPVSGQSNILFGTKAGLARWTLQLGGYDAESTGNLGSNFIVTRYNDAGAALDQPFIINRATGAAAFSGAVSFGGSVSASSFTTAGAITATGAITGLSHRISAGSGAGITGDANTTQVIFNQGAAQFNYSISVGDLYWTVNGVNVAYFPYTGSSAHIIVTGNAYKPGGGAWVDSSDIRIKNVEAEYKTGLDDIVKLQPIIYTFKGNDTPKPPESIREAWANPAVPYDNSTHYTAAVEQTKFLGLIAQEVETVFPELVTKRSGYINGVAVDDLRDLDASPLIFALINAVKELKARIEVLENGA
jgi:hypothetical protein